MFEELFGGIKTDTISFQERNGAAKGHCPDARICESREDLAGWFKSVGIAAGVIRGVKTG